jgi:MFS family permease
MRCAPAHPELLASFAVFATAFLARPIGAPLFGRYGDRFTPSG